MHEQLRRETKVTLTSDSRNAHNALHPHLDSARLQRRAPSRSQTELEEGRLHSYRQFAQAKLLAAERAAAVGTEPMRMERLPPPQDVLDGSRIRGRGLNITHERFGRPSARERRPPSERRK